MVNGKSIKLNFIINKYGLIEFYMISIKVGGKCLRNINALNEIFKKSYIYTRNHMMAVICKEIKCQCVLTAE